MKRMILVALAVGMLAGCGSGGGNGGVNSAPVGITAANNTVAYAAAVKPMNDQFAKWKDAAAIAGSTPRIAMATPVASLQAINRDTEALVVPACLKISKDLLTAGMSSGNSAYLNFMQQGSSVSFLMGLSDTAFSAYDSALLKQTACDFSVM